MDVPFGRFFFPRKYVARKKCVTGKKIQELKAGDDQRNRAQEEGGWESENTESIFVSNAPLFLFKIESGRRGGGEGHTRLETTPGSLS